MGRVQQIIEFSQFSVVNAKFRRELWIYKIMTSVFDTHPPLIYVTISSVKEIRFWNRYPPTFYVDVTKYAVFFLMASLSSLIQYSRVKIHHLENKAPLQLTNDTALGTVFHTAVSLLSCWLNFFHQCSLWTGLTCKK